VPDAFTKPVPLIIFTVLPSEVEVPCMVMALLARSLSGIAGIKVEIVPENF